MNGMTRRERQISDMASIIEILNKSKVLHLGMIDGDEPYVVPMNYGYEFIDDKLIIYLHGARRGRKIDAIGSNPKVFFEMECDLVPFEGEVACKYGLAYSSLMGRGTCSIVEDVQEKMHGLSVIMKTQTEKDFEFNEKLVSVVNVLKIDVQEYTAKYRPLPAEGM